jgi:hypothetical protein
MYCLLRLRQLIYSDWCGLSYKSLFLSNVLITTCVYPQIRNIACFSFFLNTCVVNNFVGCSRKSVQKFIQMYLLNISTNTALLEIIHPVSLLCWFWSLVALKVLVKKKK